ncbi:MAG: ERF family protein [Gemmatimonadota bacterium]
MTRDVREGGIDEHGAIYSQINKLMAELPPMPKDQENKEQHFSFRGIDAIYDTLWPLFVKHAIFVTPIVRKVHTEEYQTSRGTVMHRTLLTVEHRFYASDGSWVSSTSCGEAADAGDKSTAKAMSNAFKYAIFEVLCIPIGVKDGDAENPDGPGSARAGGKNVGGPKINPRQKADLWAATTEAAERLDVERAEILRAVLGHFEHTRSENVRQGQYDDVLAMMKQPDELLAAKAAEDESK